MTATTESGAAWRGARLVRRVTIDSPRPPGAELDALADRLLRGVSLGKPNADGYAPKAEGYRAGPEVIHLHVPTRQASTLRIGSASRTAAEVRAVAAGAGSRVEADISFAGADRAALGRRIAFLAGLALVVAAVLLVVTSDGRWETQAPLAGLGVFVALMGEAQHRLAWRQVRAEAGLLEAWLRRAVGGADPLGEDVPDAAREAAAGQDVPGQEVPG